MRAGCGLRSRLLANTLMLLLVMAGLVAAAGVASAAPFTLQETDYLRHLRSEDGVNGQDQELVDLGWTIAKLQQRAVWPRGDGASHSISGALIRYCHGNLSEPQAKLWVQETRVARQSD